MKKNPIPDLPPGPHSRTLTPIRVIRPKCGGEPPRRGYSQDGLTSTRNRQELFDDHRDPQVQHLRLQGILPVLRHQHIRTARPSTMVRVPHHPGTQVSCCPRTHLIYQWNSIQTYNTATITACVLLTIIIIVTVFPSSPATCLIPKTKPLTFFFSWPYLVTVPLFLFDWPFILFSCDIRVIRLMSERTLGNRSASLAKQLKENNSEDGLQRLAR